MRTIFVGADGRLRWGWELTAFAAIALIVYSALAVAAALGNIAVGAQTTLGDWRLAVSSLTMLVAAAVPTALLSTLNGASAGLRQPRRLRDLGAGAAAAALVVSLAVLVPVAAGVASLTLFSGSALAVVAAGLQQLVTVGPTSVGEELMLRGLPLRTLARGTHPVVAVGVTGLVFGLLHLFNPSSSWVAALNVALVGVWFGTLAVRTHSLWPSLGAHLGWNWFEGFIWGQPVSGLAPGVSLLQGAPPPLGFWGGGAFGPEAAGITSVLLLFATALTLVLTRSAALPPPPSTN